VKHNIVWYNCVGLPNDWVYRIYPSSGMLNNKEVAIRKLGLFKSSGDVQLLIIPLSKGSSAVAVFLFSFEDGYRTSFRNTLPQLLSIPDGVQSP
jgi:hypothetical protein